MNFNFLLTIASFLVSSYCGLVPRFITTATLAKIIEHVPELLELRPTESIMLLEDAPLVLPAPVQLQTSLPNVMPLTKRNLPRTPDLHLFKKFSSHLNYNTSNHSAH